MFELGVVVCCTSDAGRRADVNAEWIFHLFLGEVVPVSKICAEEVKRSMLVTK